MTYVGLAGQALPPRRCQWKAAVSPTLLEGSAVTPFRCRGEMSEWTVGFEGGSTFRRLRRCIRGGLAVKVAALLIE